MQIYPGNILSFLNQNNMQYRIPVYQRNYEWSADQCRKLFEDIVQAGVRCKVHFTGTIVYQPLTPHMGIGQNIIIDGQQRLTTIYILLKSMYDKALPGEEVLPAQALFNKNMMGQYHQDDQIKMKLKAAVDNNQQLLNLFNDKVTEEDKNSTIYKNYEYFCELITEQQAKGIGINQIYTGLTQLAVAVLQLDANDNAQEIFERINSTGVPLSLADKIRNHVLMTDENQEKLYEDYWLPIEHMLSKNLSSFFMDYMNMKVDGFVKEDDAYEYFKKLFADGGYSNESMLIELKRYAGFYNTFLNEDPDYSTEVNQILKSLQKLNQTTVFLFLFKLFDDYKNGVLGETGKGKAGEKELEKVLRFFLHYSIRRLVCEVGSNSLRGLYKTLYARVFAREDYKQHYYDAIVCFFTQLTSKDRLPSDDEFTLALKEKNLYRKNALCKYLLLGIENQGKEKLETGNLTIEHIMPQNKNLSTSWQNMLGAENWKEIQEKYLHTLGNLTLTGYNSELGDKPFDEKKKELDEAKSKVVNLYSDVKDAEVWNEEAILKRADRLSKEILVIYPVEKPEYMLSFTDPRYKEYNAENPEDATYKTPNYYVLQGERVVVTNFSEMFRSVVERFYALDSSVIEKMAKNKDIIYADSQLIMFSYDKDDVYCGQLIKGTDIYEATGFSAANIMKMIKSLLDQYEIDYSDFVYSAKSYK